MVNNVIYNWTHHLKSGKLFFYRYFRAIQFSAKRAATNDRKLNSPDRHLVPLDSL